MLIKEDGRAISPDWVPDPPTQVQVPQDIHLQLRNKETHFRLRYDLIELVGSLGLEFHDSDEEYVFLIKIKTKVIKANCNPVWNEELTLTMKDAKAPIHIAVYDKDRFSNDDSMGVAEIDVKPYIECLRMKLDLNKVPHGTKLDRVHPSKHNYLVEESAIICENGKVVQDMILRLRDVECGEVLIQIELVPLPGRKLNI
ncbi:putative C2 domain-containing protein [Helianthus anomalus]